MSTPNKCSSLNQTFGRLNKILYQKCQPTYLVGLMQILSQLVPKLTVYKGFIKMQLYQLHYCNNYLSRGTTENLNSCVGSESQCGLPLANGLRGPSFHFKVQFSGPAQDGLAADWALPAEQINSIQCQMHITCMALEPATKIPQKIAIKFIEFQILVPQYCWSLFSIVKDSAKPRIILPHENNKFYSAQYSYGKRRTLAQALSPTIVHGNRKNEIR